MKNYLGIDIGGTKCAVVLGDENARAIEKIKFPTTDVKSTLAEIYSAAEKLVKISDKEIAYVGISCGSPLDPRLGIIKSPPNLPGWDNIRIVDEIKEKLSLPAVLCNDANACALAEYKFGAGRGCDNMIFFTFGTGMGAGIIIEGRLYNGASGSAGEVGHMRLADNGPVGYGKEGSFEGFASGGGIAMLARTAAIEKLQMGKSTMYCKSYDDLDKISAKSVAEAADLGDETAASVYKRCGEMLGKGLSIVVDILNPERIVLGSIYERSSHLVKDSMEAVMRRECLADTFASVSIVPAELGDSIGDIAALTLAIEAYSRGAR